MKKPHHSPAAMTVHKRAGHARTASPPVDGKIYIDSDKGGVGDGKAKERGRRGKMEQQVATRKFMSGASEHPTAGLDRPINFGRLVDFRPSGAGQHATA